MFGNLGNLAGLLKGAKQMQEQMAKMQAELASRRYDGETSPLKTILQRGHNKSVIGIGVPSLHRPTSWPSGSV